MATAERSEIDALRRAARNRKGLGNGRALDKLTLIQIDLEDDALAVDFQRGAVVLLPRVVIFAERVERANRRNGMRDEVRTQAHMPRVRLVVPPIPVVRSS